MDESCERWSVAVRTDYHNLTAGWMRTCESNLASPSLEAGPGECSRSARCAEVGCSWGLETSNHDVMLGRPP
jgi:hypothetical protein